MKSKDTFDTYYGYGLELVYEGVNVQKSAGIIRGQNLIECLDSSYLLNCTGCQNCFGCVNLRHKSYHFFNKPLSKEEWKSRVSDILGSYKKTKEMEKKFEEFSLRFPRKENNNFKSVNCYGDYIFESKNCFNCFEVSDCENIRHSFAIKFAKDCYDLIGHARRSELLLECVGIGISSRVLGSWWVENSHDIEYSFATRSSEYCLGCDGIKNGKYCILNKQYSEEEYKKIRGYVVEELKSKNLYGIFMPPELAFFAYNETVGQDDLSMTKEEALAQGFRWEDDIPRTRGQETLRPEQIPDHIRDVQDSILNGILK